jgi:hypothetical protein
MDNFEIQCLVLIDKTILISQISAVVSELGEPDCKLSNPCRIVEITEEDIVLERWLEKITDNKDSIMISSDKILTLVDPKQTLIDNYLEFIK